MTMEEWVTEWAATALGNIPNELKPMDEGVTVEELVRKHGQRIACLFIQARARECRHLANEVLKSGVPVSLKQTLNGWLMDRSNHLETVAMSISQPDGWPVKAKGEESRVMPGGVM